MKFIALPYSDDGLPATNPPGGPKKGVSVIETVALQSFPEHRSCVHMPAVRPVPPDDNVSGPYQSGTINLVFTIRTGRIASPIKDRQLF